MRGMARDNQIISPDSIRNLIQYGTPRVYPIQTQLSRPEQKR